MKVAKVIALSTLLLTPGLAFAGDLYDPSIKHQPLDGIVKLYGAGGPHTAFQKVADVWQERTGTEVEIVAGPESRWSRDAQADADIIWGTSEQSMTAFLQTYKTFSSDLVEPIYLRPAVIAVKTGNPKNIKGFDDLLREDIRIVVTEGAGVYNTSGTGTWEDVAGRLGELEDVAAFRKNIVDFSLGSGASFRAFKEKDADAWITWPNWPLTHPDDLELVEIEPERKIWRDISVAVAPNASPEARDFVNFLISEEGQEIMASEGWVR
ncbi:extracellular solute-binding protein [Roseibium sediminicola]|uniref:Extracellular solute-binding protein n=1 Tax=Roseibium sediminicola TaxID=2933272 RepID=A0ABT0GTC7_9HYPH|nr:extracellular solute-binding protein [Roseibium sp. CAU 1639]MCK7612689.1 extracellular solute-binding protein [Roseibium sp. CAU 1639]